MIKELKWDLANSVTSIMPSEAYCVVNNIDKEVAQKAIMFLIRKEAYLLFSKTQTYPNGFSSTSVSDFEDFEIAIHGSWYKVARIAGKRSADTLVFTDPSILVTVA